MKIKIAFLVGMLFLSTTVSAEIKLPSILADGMVLQQQTDVKLWGKANAGSKVKVRVSWNDKTYDTRSDKEGNWMVRVGTPAAGGPYEITISDGKKLTLKNILIGEVWLCAGQSNMEIPVKGYPFQPVLNSNNIIAKANPRVPIRMYTTDSDESGEWVFQFSREPQTDCVGRWMDNSPENVANISAVAYMYARYLQEALDIPVGILVSTLGGTQIESWMSKEAFSAFPDIDLDIPNFDKITRPYGQPCVLYNSKLAPLTNFTIKGLIWYQGESNRHDPEKYGQLMPVFVKDLRNKWGLGEFPFYYVQIAPYKYSGPDVAESAYLREVQLQNMSEIPNSGMVTTLDVGEMNGIHPSNKEAVGERLAYWALAKTYGKKGFEYSAPVYSSMEIKNGKIYLSFDNLGYGGLIPAKTQLESFEIAGEDKIFHEAKAVFVPEVNQVVVWNESVPVPVAVRYAFKNYAKASLFTVSGLPVSSFRTDNW